MPLLRRLWWAGGGRDPISVPGALRRAEERRREGRYAEAGELVARALELDPDNLHAHLLAAYLHAARRAPERAKAEFQWVLNHDATHARALLGLARIALEEGDANACHDLLRRALRFYPDAEAGYEYPESYYQTFGVDYVPMPHVQAAYEYARKHKWYMDARMITVHDLYAFEPGMKVSIDPFMDIIGRNFRQPKEGLGFDGSPVAHMWRTLNYPDNPL